LKPDIEANRIECQLGLLGDPSPVLVSVTDVPNDEGGFVRVSWTGSYLDQSDNEPARVCPCILFGLYNLWRETSAGAALRILERGEGILADPHAMPRPASPKRIFQTRTLKSQTVFWELVATQVGRGLPAYSLVVPTPYDSLPGNDPGVLFMVQAVTAGLAAPEDLELPLSNGGVRALDISANEDCEGIYDSSTESGSSDDDTAPGAPQGLRGSYSGGVTTLRWRPNMEPDLHSYKLHRGSQESFVPDATNLISAQTDTIFADTSPGLYFYKLAAVDIHTNQSGFALLRYQDIAGVPGVAPPPELWLGRAVPNPAGGGTTIAYGVSREALVVLDIFDVAGRPVRHLVRATNSPGEHSAPWDGRQDGGGLVPNGRYYYRMTALNQTLWGTVTVAR
jgi:hypothetical protein